MFESKVIDNGKFLLPGNAVMPEWVLDRINAFKTGLYIIARDAKTDDKETLEKMTKLLKNFIIPPGVVINKRISKPELANITKQYDKVIQDDAEFTWFIWLLMNAGFLLSTVLPTSIDEDSLTIPDEIKIRRRTATAEYKETGDKRYWRLLIQVNPDGWNQKRTWTGNYQNLREMCYWRTNHKQIEWRNFCKEILQIVEKVCF